MGDNSSSDPSDFLSQIQELITLGENQKRSCDEERMKKEKAEESLFKVTVRVQNAIKKTEEIEFELASAVREIRLREERINQIKSEIVKKDSSLLASKKANSRANHSMESLKKHTHVEREKFEFMESSMKLSSQRWKDHVDQKNTIEQSVIRDTKKLEELESISPEEICKIKLELGELQARDSQLSRETNLLREEIAKASSSNNNLMSQLTEYECNVEEGRRNNMKLREKVQDLTNQCKAHNFRAQQLELESVPTFKRN